MYGDWTDIVQWPRVPGAEAIEKRRLAKQENPTEKKGIIGAFCRTYSITQAMEKFIPGYMNLQIWKEDIPIQVEQR